MFSSHWGKQQLTIPSYAICGGTQKSIITCNDDHSTDSYRTTTTLFCHSAVDSSVDRPTTSTSPTWKKKAATRSRIIKFSTKYLKNLIFLRIYIFQRKEISLNIHG